VPPSWVAAAMTSRPIELAPEPTYADAEWVSAYETDPLSVPLDEKVDLLAAWSQKLLDSPAVQHASGSLQQVLENKFYTDLSGTSTTQQRVRLQPMFEAFGTHEKTGVFDSMRTLAPWSSAMAFTMGRPRPLPLSPVPSTR